MKHSIPILYALACIAAAAALYVGMQYSAREEVLVPTLDLTSADVAQAGFLGRLRGQLVGSEKGGVPVYTVSAADVAKGFRAPTDTHVRFQCPETAGVSAKVALGDPRADEETLFWAYAYTEQEAQNIKDGKKGREAFNGDFYLSARERRESPQYASLHTGELTMAPGRRYYLMVDGATAHISFMVACGDRDGDFWNDGEDINGNGIVEPGETDPNDADTDDDGMSDGVEKAGNQLDPLKADTDGDGVQDGTELGYKNGQDPGTDLSVFIPDADPSTVTDPTKADTDGGGATDGAEDSDHNGRVDLAETDPRNPADDSVCGDGKIAAKKEVCDDGNKISGDGCSESCAVENGFTCTGEPSVCTGS